MDIRVTCKNSKEKGKNPARDDLFVTIKPTPLPCPSTLPAWRAVFSIAPTYEKLVTNGYICHRMKIFPILRFFYMAYVHIRVHTYFTSLANYEKWFNTILISLSKKKKIKLSPHIVRHAHFANLNQFLPPPKTQGALHTYFIPGLWILREHTRDCKRVFTEYLGMLKLWADKAERTQPGAWLQDFVNCRGEQKEVIHFQSHLSKICVAPSAVQKFHWNTT